MKVSWRRAVKNKSCLEQVRVLYHECERGGLSGSRFKAAGGKSYLKMPVVSGGCYVYVVELYSRNNGKVWSDEIVVRT